MRGGGGTATGGLLDGGIMGRMGEMRGYGGKWGEMGKCDGNRSFFSRRLFFLVEKHGGWPTAVGG